MKVKVLLTTLAITYFLAIPVSAGVTTKALQETGEWIMKKFGKSALGNTAEEVAENTAKIVAKYGDDALPVLQKAGPAGFEALERAGAKADDVVKLCAAKGDKGVLVISKTERLDMFLKYGDDAADALIKHPGIADNFIGKHGDEAIGALNNVSHTGAQAMQMADNAGVFSATTRSPELFKVIGKYGDKAAKFIWNNKGALTVGTVLISFLANPEAYINGVVELGGAVTEGVVKPIASNTNWTLIFIVILLLIFLYFIFKSINKAKKELKKEPKKKEPQTVQQAEIIEEVEAESV